MKPAAWLGLAIIVAALAFGATAFVRTLTPYVSFDQARHADGSVQVMGKLDKASIHYGDAGRLNFVIVNDQHDALPVSFVATRPANFEQAVQVTAIGRYDGSTFQADKLMLKCPSKYQGSDSERSYGRSTALKGI
ncbi:MAG: cytochrome c maturation protein CcmE [Capsulimonadaceae bacterium]|nr:cytochrome c maturation protein CcmE [Capsulimonadaceae bacterium]